MASYFFGGVATFLDKATNQTYIANVDDSNATLRPYDRSKDSRFLLDIAMVEMTHFYAHKVRCASFAEATDTVRALANYDNLIWASLLPEEKLAQIWKNYCCNKEMADKIRANNQIPILEQIVQEEGILPLLSMPTDELIASLR